jgi:hypothetical protein
VLKGSFASSVFNIYNAKTQMTQICVTGPQCVKEKVCTVHTFAVSHDGFGDDWSNIMLSINFQAHDIGDFLSVDGEESDMLECCAVCMLI